MRKTKKVSKRIAKSAKTTKPTAKPVAKLKRGFAVMSKKLQRHLASMGGKVVAKRKGWLAKIGRLGGLHSHMHVKHA